MRDKLKSNVEDFLASLKARVTIIQHTALHGHRHRVMLNYALARLMKCNQYPIMPPHICLSHTKYITIYPFSLDLVLLALAYRNTISQTH
jgi:hypothetical protein